MAVISVTEDFKGSTAHDRIQPDGRALGDARRFFDVQFSTGDLAAVRPMLALSSGEIPQLGEEHPFSIWMYVLDRRATVTAQSPLVYRVVIIYNEINDPVNEPARIEWSSANTNEPVYVGENNSGDLFALLTSSDEPFDPPPTKEVADLVMRATYNTDIFNPVVASEYQNAINDRPIMIRGFTFATGTGKVITYNAFENRSIANILYLDIVVEIQFREKGWRRSFLDLGFRTTDGFVGSGIQKYKTIRVDPEDDSSDEVSEPVMLDGFGQRETSGTITKRRFWLNDRLNFASVFGAFLS